MKLYLTIFLIVLASTYRFTRRRSISLPTVPTQIYYLEDNLLVTQAGRDITVYNTSSDKNVSVVQSFTADSDNPEIQVSRQTRKVLFKNNKSIFQIQEAKEPQTLQLSTEQINWVYKLGAHGNHTIMHTMSSTSGGRTIYYLDIYDEGEYKSWSDSLVGENVIAGSGVQSISEEEYYFASGGMCNKEQEDDIFLLYEGDSTGIQNVYNFSVSGCNYPIEEGHKQEWDLTSISIGGSDRWYALTYVLDIQNKPRWFTTQVVAKVNGITEQVLRFDTSRLIGAQFLNKKLYTADEGLCRITEHRFQNYLNSTQDQSYLPADVVQTVLSADEQWLVGLTATSKSYILSRLNQTFQLSQTIESPNSKPILEAYFTNQTKLILKDNSSILHLYDVPNSKYTTASVGAVDDYCVTDASMIYTFTKEANDQYILHVLGLRQVNQDLDLTQLGSRVLAYPSSDLLCIGNDKVLVNPVNFGDPIRMWQYNSTFTNTASLIKLQTLHDVVYKTKNYIFFTNTDKRTTPIFYNFNLYPIGISNFIMMAPDTVHHFVKTWSDHLVVAVGDDLTNLIAYDYYQIVGQSLNYKGSYSLLNNGTAKIGRTVVLPTSQKIHIDYGGWQSKVIRYELAAPPQYIKGMFYDATLLDCNGYSNALFRINNVTNKTEMIVINGLEDTPVLQRFSFEGTTANLEGTAYVDNYLYTKLSIVLSANTQNVLVYGIKKTSTLEDCIQIRSSTNLGDITFEKIYFQEMDPSDIQSFTLIQNNVFASVISTDDNQTIDHYVNLLNQPNSGGKVSTGQVGEVVVYTTCVKCNFIAVVGSTDRSRIYLTNVNSGVRQRIVDAECQVELLGLNLDGTIIGYMCTDKRLMVFNTQTELHYSQNNPHPQATELKILSQKDVVLTQGGKIYHVTIDLVKSVIPKKISTDRLLTKLNINKMKKSSSNAAVSFVVDYEAGTYAYPSQNSDSIIFSNNLGNVIDIFPLEDNQVAVSLAFAPNGELTVATNNNDLIMITPEACLLNYTQIDGYCICDPTFDNTGGKCQCSPQHYYEELMCKCEDGKFFQSTTNCADCSAFCSTCTTGDGIGDCDSYGAVFFIMIVGIILVVLVVVIIIVIWILRKKKAAKKGKQSSQLAGDQKLMEDDDKD